MSFIVTIVHVFVSLFLMLTVLLQAGKGGGMGATFGGGSSQGSVFGGSGAGNFLSKLTTASAAMFMITSMTLAFLASTTGEDSLKKFSAQQRGHAAEKQRLDKEAGKMNKATQPDGGLVDEIDPEATDTSEIDAPAGDAPATPEADKPEAAAKPEAPPAEKKNPAIRRPPVKNPAVKADEPKPAKAAAPAPKAAAPAPAAEPKPAGAPTPAAEPKPAGGE